MRRSITSFNAFPPAVTNPVANNAHPTAPSKGSPDATNAPTTTPTPAIATFPTLASSTHA